MSDWSKLLLCPECGAANPQDVELCLRCNVALKEAIAKSEANRLENIALRIMKSQRPKGCRYNKPVNELTIKDIRTYPVWEYDLAGEGRRGKDETWVRPVKDLPVSDLSNRVVGTMAQMANGESVYCLLGSVSLNNLRRTRQFLGVIVFRSNADSFTLARYFDADYEEHGPKALAKTLGLSLDEVFPIRYDISNVAHGLESVVKGIIDVEVKERLSDKERLALTLERR